MDGQKLKTLVTYFESETRGGVRVGYRVAVVGIKRVGCSLVSAQESPGRCGGVSVME